jgi:hypothetical protein
MVCSQTIENVEIFNKSFIHWFLLKCILNAVDVVDVGFEKWQVNKCMEQLVEIQFCLIALMKKAVIFEFGDLC